MNAGVNDSNNVRIVNSFSPEAAELAIAVIDYWQQEGGVEYKDAIINQKNASLKINAMRDGQLRSLDIVGSMNFGFDGTGPRCTAEVLAHTKSFGELEEIQAKLFKKPTTQALVLRPV